MPSFAVSLLPLCGRGSAHQVAVRPCVGTDLSLSLRVALRAVCAVRAEGVRCVAGAPVASVPVSLRRRCLCLSVIVPVGAGRGAATVSHCPRHPPLSLRPWRNGTWPTLPHPLPSPSAMTFDARDPCPPTVPEFQTVPDTFHCAQAVPNHRSRSNTPRARHAGILPCSAAEALTSRSIIGFTTQLT